jgi:tetratricopeptide (TPR) repeat protein
VIEWSWDLLTERQRVLCRRVAMFPDGFTADAARYVAPDGPDEIAVLDDLDALVGQSLLRVEEHRSTGTTRYRMLETVREFGERETRTAGDGAAVRDALLDWARDVCVQIVARSESPDRILLDPAGEAEHDNLVALLRGVLASHDATGPRPDAVAALYAVLGPRWLLQGAEEEVEGVQTDVLAAVRGWDAPPPLVDALVLTLTVVAVTEPLFGDVRTGARARPELRRAVACPPGPSPLPAMLAQLALSIARPAEVERVLAGARSSDLLPLRRFALLMSGMLAENNGEIEEAIVHATAAFDLALQSGEVWSQVMAASSVAGALAQSLRPREALDWVETGTHLLSELSDTEHSVASPLTEGLEQTRGFALLSLGRHREAEEVFGTMAAQSGHRNEPVLLGRLGIAESTIGRGDAEQGLELLRDLVRQVDATSHGDPWLLMALATCVAAHALAGRTDAPGIAQAADRLVETLVAGRGMNPMFTDRPVLGMTMVSVGAWRTATTPDAGTGLELLALAEQLQSPQDHPSMLRATHWAVAERVYGAAAVEQARAEAAALLRDEQLPRAMDVLRAG